MDLGDLFGDLSTTVGDAATALVNAATQAEIAKINAKALRPPAPVNPAAPVAQLTTSQKLGAVASSPKTWLAVAGIVGAIVLIVWVVRR